jgi:hypothetical protein
MVIMIMYIAIYTVPQKLYLKYDPQRLLKMND